MFKLQENSTILHLILTANETSAPYNEHCLPMANKREISVCTYFKSGIVPPENITLFEGDGSLPGFNRALRSALNAKEYDVIHAHSPHVGLLFLVGAQFWRKRLASSAVMTIHDSYPNFKSRNQLMLLPIFAGFQRVICCSNASYDSFPMPYKVLAGDRLGVVQNGVDMGRVDHIAETARKRRRQADEFEVVAISRLVDIKNPVSILTAFQQSADQTSRLIYIGDGPLRPPLTQQSKEAGFEGQIRFTGLIPRESVFDHLLNADLFISTSRGEGLPISVLEAMSCRCPVLLSDIPPHREIAEGIDFIPLVQPDDTAGFAREIEKFRKMSKSERAMIGQKCRELVAERFSLSAMHDGYAAVYAQVTRRPMPSLLAEVR